MAARPVILVADDAEDIRALLGELRAKEHDVKFASTGAETLLAADTEPLPDLILLDIGLPDTDGFDVCQRLKANPALADIPVIFVTARSDPEDEARGLAAGAVDYITKPISPPITLARVRAQLALVSQRRALEQEVRARTEELERTRLEIIRRLARAMEYREGGLTQRVLRVAEYVALLASALGLRENVCEVLAQASALYDIGKLGVPEHILRKTDRLTEREWTEVRRHPEIGAAIIGEHRDPLLAQARIMALAHHERWDGSGYPGGLKGEAIPLAGRIAALADAYEAMTTTQRHRAALAPSEAARRIAAESGRQFDPRVAAAFGKVAAQFEAVRAKYRDELAGIHDLDFTAPRTP